MLRRLVKMAPHAKNLPKELALHALVRLVTQEPIVRHVRRLSRCFYAHSFFLVATVTVQLVAAIVYSYQCQTTRTTMGSMCGNVIEIIGTILVYAIQCFFALYRASL